MKSPNEYVTDVRWLVSGLTSATWLQLYLAPSGAFLMVCPKARHRHGIERLRAMLLEAEDLEACVTDVPEWLREGLSEEAQLLEHEIVIAQWRGGRRADGGVPALALGAPAKL